MTFCLSPAEGLEYSLVIIVICNSCNLKKKTTTTKKDAANAENRIKCVSLHANLILVLFRGTLNRLNYNDVQSSE